MTTPIITVHGTVRDESAVTVRVQGHRVGVADGVFTADVSLHSGLNQIEVEAADDAGNHTRLTRQVRFEDLRRIQALVPPLLTAAGLPDLGHITSAPDGSLLATAPHAGRIYRVPLDGSPPHILFENLRYPLGIATTRDGAIYVAEQGADRILRISPDGTKMVVLDQVNDPQGLALGNEGELFITAKQWPQTDHNHKRDAHHGEVLRLELGTGAVGVLDESLVRPEGIVAAQESQNEVLWVAAERRQGEDEWRDADLFRITLAETVTPFPGPHLSRPRGLTRDTLGNLWLTARRQFPRPEDIDDSDDDDYEWDRGVLFKISSEGIWQRFAKHLDEPAGLVFSAQGDLFVVEADRGRILRFRAPPAPQVVTPLPSNSSIVTLTGSVEKGSALVARGPAGTNTAPTDVEGHFQIDVPLLPNQSNPIELFAVAAAGSGLSSIPTKIVVVEDRTPPTLSVENPPNDALTNGISILVSGRVTDELSPVQVFVNDIAISVDAGGSFATTIPLLEGPNEVRLRAADAAGNATIDTRIAIRDTTPPTITITSPAEGSVVTRTIVAVTGTVGDSNPPASVSVNGQPIALLPGGKFDTDIPFPISQTSITVAATDRAGNTSSFTRTVVRDVTPPVITLVSGPPDPTNTPTLTVTVRATDNVASVDQIQYSFSLDSETDYSPYGLASSVTYRDVADGPHTIRARARDQAGNESAPLVVTVRVNTAPPAITLTAPADRFLTNQPSMTVTGTVTDVSAIAELTVNGRAATVIGTTFTANLSLAEGPNTITVTAKDAAGNIATTSLSGTLDTAPPILTLVNKPADPTNARMLTLSVSATDGTTPSEEIQFAFSLDNETAFGSYGGTPTMTYDVANDGPHIIRVKVRDRAGNESAPFLVSVRVDTEAPILIVTTPSPGFLTNQTQLTVTGTVSDSGGVSAVTVNGQPTILSGAAFIATVPLAEGSNTLTVTASDAAGNSSSAAVTGTLDTLAPVVTLSTPVSGFITSQATTIVSGTVTDAGALAEVTVNGQPVSLNGTNFTAVHPLTEGANTLTVHAKDAAGNIGTATVSGTLDTLPPALAFTAPDAEAVLNTSPLTVTGAVNEAVGSLAVNGIAAIVSGATFSVNLTPTRGRNTLTANAIDLAGNVGTVSRSFTFDDVAPVVRILTPANGGVLNQVNLTVTGTVNDPTAGVSVNGVGATILGSVFTASGVIVSAGSATLTAQAVDPAGNVGTDQVTVSVDTTPPVISALVVPTEVSAGTAVTLSASASDNLGLATLDLLLDGRLVASGTTSPVSVSVTIPPDKAVNDALTVTARAVDVAGLTTTQFATMRVITAAVGPGFLRGLVLDDTKGLPLAGATVSVTVAGGATVDTQVTGPDGQYAFTMDPGTAVVRVMKEGMTTAERKVPVRSDLLSVVPDARLTPRDSAITLVGSTGGVAADQANAVRLVVPATALAEDVSITITSVSDQGLVARLPQGWSPVIVADIAPASLTFSSPALLSLRLPNSPVPRFAPGTSITIARYDPAQAAWVVLDPGTVTNDGLAIEAAVGFGGQVAFLIPDPDPQSPPAIVPGQPLTGVSAAAIPEDATATGSVTPSAIPPGASTAKGQVTVTPTAPLPSGTIAQAVVSEAYTLLSGEEVTPPAFVQDLVLYQCGMANDQCPMGGLGTSFAVTPSKTYTLKELAIGTVHLAVQTPETEGQGTIIGPEGGTLSASDGTILIIPAGALTRETVVALGSINEGDLRVAIPAGFQVLKAVTIDLTRATLSLSAEIAFPLPAGVTSDTQVLVARVIEVDGILRLQAVGVGQVSGGLLSSRAAVPGANLLGITGGGTYVALRAINPVGFVAGTISDAGGINKAGVVVSSGTGLVDLSRSDGRYLVAIASGNATLTASDRATGQRAGQTLTVPTGGAATQPLQVQVIPPTVVSVSPAASATSVPVSTQITLTFSQPIAKLSITASSLVLSGPSGPVEATITMSPLGTAATLYPSKALASQTTYTLVASQAIQDTHGVPLSTPFTSQFTTASAPPPPPPAGAITVSFPDEQGNVTVTATQGTAAPDNLAVVLNVSSGTVASARVSANGAFTTALFALLGDELLVMIQDGAGSQTVVSPGPYRSSDGQFVMTRAGGSLETPEGVSLTLAASAVTQPVTLKVMPITLEQVATAVPPGLQFLGGLRLDTQGASFNTGAKVSLPIPTGITIPTGVQPFLARLQTIGGQLTPVLVDTMRAVNGKLATASPPFPGVLKEGDYVALLPANPYPAVVTGSVLREGTTPARPISGAILKVDGTEIVALTDDKGKYALELFPPDVTKPTTFNLVALDPASGTMRGVSLTVPGWTVPIGGGSYTLDVALPSEGAGRDTVPPKIDLTVDAPSLKNGRVALGDTVTVIIKATDEIGVRGETLTLTKNGAPLQLTLGGSNTSSTASLVATTPWDVITLVATAQDTSGKVGHAETTIQVTGAGGSGGEVPPSAPPDQPLKILSAGTYPPKGARQVDTATSVTLLFNQPVVNPSSDLLVIREQDLDIGTESIVDIEVQVDPSDPSVVVLKPKNRLRYRATYTIAAKADLQGVNQRRLGQDYESDFSTLDLTGPSIPIMNGRDVVVYDKYAIVLDRTDGLVTVDISDPTTPSVLQTTAVFTGPFAANQGFALAPDFAYVDASGQPVYAPAIVVVGWISLPQGGMRGLLRLFDLTDPIRPKRIGSATIARCTTGVPTQVLIKDQYAVVASLFQGLVVVDLNAVIGDTIADIGREGLSAGGGTLNQGTTLPIAGPIGMSFQEDAANERCDSGQPKAVVGIWDAGGKLKSPLTLKAYGPNVLVGDQGAGVYRVALDNLPSLNGFQVYTGSAFRLDAFPDMEITDPTTNTTRHTAVAAVVGGKTLTLVDVGTGIPLSSRPTSGVPISVHTDLAQSQVFVGTSQGTEVIYAASPTSLRAQGMNKKLPVGSGESAGAGSYWLVPTADMQETMIKLKQDNVIVTFYDARDFKPVYSRQTQELRWPTKSLKDMTDLENKMMMKGAQADGVSLLIVKAEIPDRSTATSVKFALKVGADLGTNASTGGLYADWPDALTVRAARGQQEITVPVVTTSQKKKIALAMYHPPTEFVTGDDYRASQREVSLAFETDDKQLLSQTRQILIKRPPVVLIHGYNSDTDTGWKYLMISASASRNSAIKAFTFNRDVNYEAINTNGVEMTYKKIPPVLESLRDDARSTGIAVTRFDILAHSFGGLATWTYITDLEDATIVRPTFLLSPELDGKRVLDRNPGRGDPDGHYYFRRSSNYGAGTINRVITVGTPYNGSPLGDAALAELQIWAEAKIKDKLTNPLGFLLADSLGNGDRTAYADFAALEKQKEGSALSWLHYRTQPTGVPIHTIIGRANSKSLCPDWVSKLLTLALEPGNSDLIVPEESQRGGLEYPATQNLERVCHTDETNHRFGEKSVPLLELLPDLLNNPRSAERFYGKGLPVQKP